MGITSRKAESLFSQATLAFAANHKAKSERIGRTRTGNSRAKLASSLPQPAGDVESKSTRQTRAGAVA